MNFNTIKAFIKKHTQSPEEYITEFDVEEMNEWLHDTHAAEMKALDVMGIQMAFVECFVPGKKEHSNDFWLVLMPVDGRFSIRQFAEGSPHAKSLVESAFKAAPGLAAANARVAKAFHKDAFIFHGARSVFFNDWVVDIASKSMDAIGHWKTQSFVDVDTDYLETMDTLCTAQENVALLQNKEFILSKLLSPGGVVQPMEMTVFDVNSELVWAYTPLPGLELGPNHAMVPVAYKNNRLQAIVGVNWGNGYVPLLQGTKAHLCRGSELAEIEIEDGSQLSGDASDDGLYDAEEVLVLEFSDADLNLKPGTLEILNLGQSPLDMVKFARGEETRVRESYAFDFSLDNSNESGVSL